MPGLHLTRKTDPLPHRPHLDHRPPENNRLFRAAAEAQGDRGVCGWNHTDPAAVAAGGVLGRAVWDLCPLWGFLRYDGVVCGEYSCGGALSTARAGVCCWWEEECGVAGLNGPLGVKDELR